MHRDPMVWMAREFEIRTRKLLEDDMRLRDLRYMRFRWDRYLPWYFLGDVLIWGGLITALVWWLLR